VSSASLILTELLYGPFTVIANLDPVRDDPGRAPADAGGGPGLHSPASADYGRLERSCISNGAQTGIPSYASSILGGSTGGPSITTRSTRRSCARPLLSMSQELD
jgi:hypothetical protein